MAAPTRNLYGSATTGATNSDTLTCGMSTMASGALVGDKIVLFCTSDGTQTQSISSGAGWSKVAQEGVANVNIALYEFDVTVAGTVPDLVIDMGATTEMACAQFVRVRPSAGTITRITPTQASGDSTNPDPPSISNGTGGAIDAYVLAAFGGDMSASTADATAGPASYGNFETARTGNTQGVTMGLSDRTLTGWANGASENPGTFTRVTEQWAAMTVAYYEVGGATAVEPNDALHAHSSTQPTISAKSVVEPDDAAHGHTSTQPTIAAKSVVAPANTSHGHTAASPTITLGVVGIDPADAQHGHSASQPIILPEYVFDPNDAAHGHSASQPVIVAPAQIEPDDAFHGGGGGGGAAKPKVVAFFYRPA